jgi:hypothetical protein
MGGRAVGGEWALQRVFATPEVGCAFCCVLAASHPLRRPAKPPPPPAPAPLSLTPTLSDNKLAGPLPPLLGAAGSALQWLDVIGNKLTGAIPAEWAQGDLYRVFLSGNRELKGCIPQELWEATRGLMDCAGTRLTCRPCA